jgi:hypothetical protein
LTGCTPSTDFSDLGGKAGTLDALPESLPAYASSDLKVESVRYVGTARKIKFFLASGLNSGVCLVAYKSESSWVGACGGSELGVSFDGNEMRVVPTSRPDQSGWQRVGHNVLLKNR